MAMVNRSDRGDQLRVRRLAQARVTARSAAPLGAKLAWRVGVLWRHGIRRGATPFSLMLIAQLVLGAGPGAGAAGAASLLDLLPTPSLAPTAASTSTTTTTPTRTST